MRQRLDNMGVILGVPVSVVDERSLLDAMRAAVDHGSPTVFVGLYAALFRRLRSDSAYFALVARSVTYPDGFGVVRELRKRGVADTTRLATTDVIHPLARLATELGWRVALFGAAPGVAERAAQAIRASAPGISIVAIWDGFSGGPSVEELRDLRPQLLLVAIGAHAQERWSYEVAVPAGVPAIVTCGGLFDFLAGDKRRAPAWMQRMGLEWLFRLALEPRRLISRYLLGNSDFLLRARAERARGRPIMEN